MKIATLLKPTAVACALTFATSAIAAPVSSNNVQVSSPFNATTWFMSSNTFERGTCQGTSGFTINEGHADGRGDAFDTAWEIFVDGSLVSAPNGTVDLTGSTVTLGPVVKSGLNVTTQYYFSQTSSVARIMVFLQNPNGAAVTTQVGTVLNLGSDQQVSTNVRGTSSGDLVFNNADNWVVTDDGYVSDPVVTGVYAGPGAAVRPTYRVGGNDQGCIYSDDIAATYSVTVPAGSTRSLMFFAGLAGMTVQGNSNVSATQAAAAFNSDATFAPDWMSGISAAQRSQIVNWSFFTTCAAEGYTGSKLTLCRSVCETTQSSTTLASKIKLYTAIYRETPPCGV